MDGDPYPETRPTPPSPADMTADETYDRLLTRVKRLANLHYAASVLRWDQQVTMPEDGTAARSRQLSAIDAVHHDLLVDAETGELLSALEEEDLPSDREAVLREVGRDYDRAVSVPTSLVEAISQAESEGIPRWKRAKAEDDFEHFAPILERIVELRQDYARHIAPDRDPYEVLYEDYEPYLPLETAAATLEQLREALVPLLEAIRESDVSMPVPFDGTYETATQEGLSRDALTVLGYDWDRGRLDPAPHPFSTGTVYDARVTTRYDESDPLDALSSTIHEFGHAAYTLGLPEEHYATPLGRAQGLTVHESQSRFWENHIGRTLAFWQFFQPTLCGRFPSLEGCDPETLYRRANTVHEDNLIRVEADELTYHLHIILRFEIERDLVRDELDVAEVPAVWNDKMEEYLGVRPQTDTNGCLQDIHWSHGSLGYFPTYSLGSILAAQIDAALRRDVGDVDALVREGKFDPIRDWHQEHVHRHGSRFRTPDLIERATGEPFTADYFIEYVTEKYSRLYDL